MSNLAKMGDLSEEMLLDYISKAGGKVKNADILTAYKHLINHHDKQLRGEYYNLLSYDCRFQLVN